MWKWNKNDKQKTRKIIKIKSQIDKKKKPFENVDYLIKIKKVVNRKKKRKRKTEKMNKKNLSGNQLQQKKREITWKNGNKMQ